MLLHLTGIHCNFYAFLPFSVLNVAIKKIQEEQVKGILVMPIWPTQIWYLVLLIICIDKPVILTSGSYIAPEFAMLSCAASSSFQDTDQIQNLCNTYFYKSSPVKYGKYEFLSTVTHLTI